MALPPSFAFGRRILVTGNAGSGKSTLATHLASALGLPLVGLDAVVWRPGWVRTPLAERRGLLREIAAGPAWVVDGVSTDIAHAADTVVFLDVAPHVCAWRCALRNVRWLFRSRPGLPEGCPELLVVPELIRTLFAFDRTVRPRILDLAGGPGFLHVRSNAQRDALLRHARSLTETCP
jgi:hypothetical protein